MIGGNLEISTVVGCKMRCNYCPQTVHVNNYSKNNSLFKLPFEDFKKCISTIPTSVDIVFAGMAEPWMNEDCTSMIEYAYEKGHTISVFTTCFGMTHEDIERLKNIQYKHFCFHLPDGDGVMNLNVTDEYVSVVVDAVKKITNHNLTCIGNLHPKLKEVLGHVPDSSIGLYSRAGNLKGFNVPRKTGKIFCSVCTEHLNHNVLLPNGDVLLCCMDYSNDHVIGNLNEITYADLFHTDEYKRITAGLSDESINILCRTCEISKNV